MSKDMDSIKNIFKLAMIGCGGYAGYLIDRLAELPKVCELLAVTTPDPDDPSAQACREKGLPVYNSADELLDNISPETCDAVLIPTSIDSHYEYARMAVEHGFHVLLEKPPVATIQDLDRLIELQRESGKFIAVNFQHLYSDATQQLKHRLGRGEFGAIRCVKGHALWQRPEYYFSRSFWSGRLQIDGKWVLDGTIGNPLAHLMAEALYLASPAPGMANPVRVQAELYHANDIESEDTSVVRLETEKDVPVFFCASLCGDEMPPILCEIETDQATIRLHDHRHAEIHYRDGREEVLGNLEPNEQTDRNLMIKSVCRALLRHERPMITVEECRPYMLAWNGAFESAGQPAAIAFDRKESEHGTMRVIDGIKELSQKAFREQQTFSELGIDWAMPGAPVDLSGYGHFPSLNPVLMDRELV
ncbi:MAG: Gfo/Idh/MocA family oxidoreductase, partial [Verrucomicrobiota bacterium]|nr:Gfo/Idh/MocA family oxidoreductase [Verrucomicrobiota bacterium]